MIAKRVKVWDGALASTAVSLHAPPLAPHAPLACPLLPQIMTWEHSSLLKIRLKDGFDGQNFWKGQEKPQFVHVWIDDRTALVITDIPTTKNRSSHYSFSKFNSDVSFYYYAMVPLRQQTTGGRGSSQVPQPTILCSSNILLEWRIRWATRLDRWFFVFVWSTDQMESRKRLMLNRDDFLPWFSEKGTRWYRRRWSWSRKVKR